MKMNLQKITFSVLMLLSFSILGSNYVIYSVSHNLPMGEKKDEEIKKNYYVNIGLNQGVKEGTVLAVYRRVVKQDPYETKTRYTHKIKLAEVEVLHVENNTAITSLRNLDLGVNKPMIEIEAPMIGDSVEVVTQ